MRTTIVGGDGVYFRFLCCSCLIAAAASLSLLQPAIAGTDVPGAPGQSAPHWSFAGKTGIGTAYNGYAPAGATPASLVWFSLAQGMVTETMFGMIHEVQLKDLQFAVKGADYLETEPADSDSQTTYLDTDGAGHPLALAYRLRNRSKAGHYEIEKHVFTDPTSNSLFLRVIFRAKDGPITPTLLLHPALNGRIGGDLADCAGGVLHAEKAGTHMVVKISGAPAALSVGVVGRAAGGNIEMAAALAPIASGEAVYDIVIGFGHSRADADQAAEQSLRRGYDTVLRDYESGWESYLAQLPALPALAQEAGDGGKLAYASAMVLKAQEDKLHPGALIASLSTPWGDSRDAATLSTGYRAVWPRDFYQCAMALLALGDKQTPVAALNYLKTVQVGKDTAGNKGAGGWFLQKTHVDGVPEWIGVQLDQTAMPLMLAWKLSQAGLVDDATLATLYKSMLQPAARFLADGGDIALQWNKITVKPPFTQQERWEEQPGQSPSTTAAIVAGLIAAAELADKAGDKAGAAHYRRIADQISAKLESGMVTHFAASAAQGAAPAHYLRIAPTGHPDAHDRLLARNGKAALPQESYLDAGFLELVRYGVRPANDPVIEASLAQLDDESLSDELRVKYEFHFPGSEASYPGWRRYGNDGYGEDAATGVNFDAKTADRLATKVDDAQSPTQRGRVWPIFTGERGHYELARAAQMPGGPTAAQIDQIKQVYVRAMELFANQGLMLPEQVWDGIGDNPGRRFSLGAGTDSATPLSWAHAEYIKLLRSIHDKQVWDNYAPVAARYSRSMTENNLTPGK